jgi:two-component system, sensor histidine kinase and response regulator
MLGILPMKILLAGRSEWTEFMEGLYPFGYEFRCCPSPGDVRAALRQEPEASLIVIGESADRESRLEFSRAGMEGAVPIVARMPLDSLDECLAALDAGLDDVFHGDADPAALHLRILSLLKARGRLKELQELQRAREELTHIVVHDLKSPLTLIMIELGMLERWWAKGMTEKFLASLTRLNQKCGELARQVHEVVDAGKLEKGRLPLNPGRTSVDAILRQALAHFGPKAQARGVQVETELEDFQGVAVLDAELSTRALVTLLEVVLRLTPDNGRMVLRGIAEEERARVVLGGGERALAPELRDRFFDAFAYLERRPLGLNAITGLGLHFCQLLFDAQGGSLAIRNRGDSGFFFEIELPLAEETGRGPETELQKN